MEERLEVQASPGRGFPSFAVRNPLHGTRYEVYAPIYPDEGPWMCECPDYAHRGAGRCKHIDAVRRWLADHPVPAFAPTQGDLGRDAVREVTELLRGLPTSEHHELPRRLRWAEAVLNPGPNPRDERSPDRRSARRRTAGSE